MHPQGRKELEALIEQVKGTRDRMRWGPAGPPPLVVKIAPDLTDADKEVRKLGVEVGWKLGCSWGAVAGTRQRRISLFLTTSVTTASHESCLAQELSSCSS